MSPDANTDLTINTFMKALESSREVPTPQWSTTSENSCIEKDKKYSLTLPASFVPQARPLSTREISLGCGFSCKTERESRVQLP